MVLKLYSNIFSAPGRAVLMVMKELELDFDFIVINLDEKQQLKKEFIKMNPQHTIPTLVDDDFIIWDSHAICAYLVGKYGNYNGWDSLYPSDLKKRAVIDQRLHYDSGILFPCLKNALWPILNEGEKEIPTENVKAVQEAYELLEIFLGNNNYLAGNSLTIADFCCVATISTATLITPIPGSKCPKLLKWYNMMKTLPYYKEANEKGLNCLDRLLRKKLSIGI